MTLSIAFTIDSVIFTPGVIAGTESLGGSESACLGLARALRARGHDVHIFATKVAPEAPPVDHAGVAWHALHTLGRWAILKDFDVLVALRMALPLTTSQAKLRILWNQDLMLPGPMANHTMGCAWAYDRVAYVSRYHREQWEAIVPDLAPIGYDTRNGYDPAHVPSGAVKRPNRILHISRPERAMAPLLAMWPAVRAAVPDAELAYCRYSSMYDAGPGGWQSVCDNFDAHAQAVQAAVGGIVPLGELGKGALYQAIAEAAVMWYPGVTDFGETSCIAAIEAQACGTPFVGSFKGALPETVPSGLLIAGDAMTPAYQAASVAAVTDLLAQCRRQSFGYRKLQQAGRDHVAPYTYAAIAAEWEAWLLGQFETRYRDQKPAILARALHDDDHVTAKVIAAELGDQTAAAFCDYVIAGKDHTAAQYAAHACDPIAELRHVNTKEGRLGWLLERMAGQTRLLDIACGSGAFAIGLAQADPARHITAIDYAQGNIDALTKAASALGVADRITAICAPVWDFDTQAPSAWFAQFLRDHGASFDAVWCGEFIEHVADCTRLVTTIEQAAQAGAAVAFSCPFGPMVELVPRSDVLNKGHVHHFRAADLAGVFGQKANLSIETLSWGPSPCGHDTGNWLIAYTASTAPTGLRPLERRQLLRPYATVTAAILCDHTLDIRRALDGVWPIADEVLIGDTGLSDYDREALLKEFPRKTRIVPVGRVHDLPGGFSEARNVLLDAATSDWFLWIDSDEHLLGGMDLVAYLDSAVYAGYAIAQNHLHIDQPMTKDTPVRVFRRDRDIRFYGCIHEQPQQGGVNGDVMPSLQINNVQIAHTGYLHEAVRREKAMRRNLPLLVRDQERFPDRTIGKLVTLREYANLAMWSRESAGGALTDEAKSHYRRVVGMFETYFADPAHRYHDIARAFYESALSCVDGAMEVEYALAGKAGGLKGAGAKPKTFWARTPEQIKARLDHHVAEALKPMTPPALAVEPVVGRSWGGAAEAPAAIARETVTA